VDRSKLKDILSNCLLFQGAGDAELEQIAGSLIEDTFKKGDPIILEGQLSDHVYFITEGAVEIVKYRPEVQMVSRVTVLNEGSYFSEFSVLNRANKSASAFALEDTIVHRMNGAAFLELLQRVPAIATQLVMTLAELNGNTNISSSLEYFDPTCIEYSSEIARALPNTLWKRYGFLPLNCHGGILQVAIKNPKQPDFFAFCQKALPQASVTLMIIGEADYDLAFRKLTQLYSAGEPPAMKPSDHKDIDVMACLRRSPYFENASDAGLASIAKMFEVLDLQPGAVIFQPGQPPEYFYIVASGQVELNHQTADKLAWTGLRVRRAGAGFGEISLLFGHPHATLARATLPSKVLRMKRDIFEQFLGSPEFCVNMAKILAKRLQDATEITSYNFLDESKPVQVKELAALIPRQIMHSHQIVPLRSEGKNITLGLVNPGNEAIFAVAHRYLRGYRISVELVPLEKFNAFVGKTDMAAVGAHKPAVVAAAAAKPAEGTVLELNRLLADGFESRASDLHLEPTGTGYAVRYRVDGVLTEVASSISAKQGETLVNRIKVVSQLDISNHFTPQDGQLKIVENNRDLIARVATTPTKHGEGVVMRLIRNRHSAVPLSALTPVPRTVKMLRQIAKLKQGLFLVTGPTGSGKTTTLYSMIAELNRVDVKIITLEDPVELEIAGVTQIEINEKIGLTFSKALRSTLRQDPDVMVLGEIRDADSARSVFEAAEQGHLVISTLHTNNSFAVMSRLKELGVPSNTIAAGLVGSLAQRLVRAVCKKCRVQRLVTKHEHELLSTRLNLSEVPSHVWSAKGCMMCNNTGYSGRLPIIEVWQKTTGMEELLSQEAGIDKLHAEARKAGFMSMFDTGLEMALNGLTTIEEVERCMSGNL